MAAAFGVAALAALSIAYPVVATVQTTNSLLERVESREIARVWIEENVPEGSTIAIEPYVPYVDPKRYHVQEYVMTAHTPEWYATNGVDYLVFSEGTYGRFYAEPERYAGVIAQYSSLFNAFESVKTVSVGGYDVRIYRVSRR